MPTFTALTTLRGKAAAAALSDAMERLIPEPTGIGQLEVTDGADIWEVSGYFSAAPDTGALALLAAAFGAGVFAISEVPEIDWVAHVRRELAPIIAGRFFLYGSHDANKVPVGVVALEIDAAQAFGTGHHSTTQGCLIALDRLAGDGFIGRNIADIGCGTAVLAMAAAKIWPDNVVLASDIDEIAVETAIANARMNDLVGRLDCFVCAGFGHPELVARAPFDLVFANILKAPLLSLAPDMAESVAADGVAILSGLLNEQADEVITAYLGYGFCLVQHDEINEWSTLTLKKPRR